MRKSDWVSFFEEALGDQFSADRIDELSESARIHENMMNEVDSYRCAPVERFDWEAKCRKLEEELRVEREENEAFRKSFGRKWNRDPCDIVVRDGGITSRI